MYVLGSDCTTYPLVSIVSLVENAFAAPIVRSLSNAQKELDPQKKRSLNFPLTAKAPQLSRPEVIEEDVSMACQNAQYVTQSSLKASLQ